MPIDFDIDQALNPLGFLVRRGAYPPEIELFHNGTIFLFTIILYFVSFIAGFHLICLSCYFALCVDAYAMYKNLKAINDGWEKRRAEEAEVEDEEVEGDETEEAEVDEDAAKEETPSESESELEEGEIKEDRVPPPSLEISDDSEEDLPPLIPVAEARRNPMDEVD